MRPAILLCAPSLRSAAWNHIRPERVERRRFFLLTASQTDRFEVMQNMPDRGPETRGRHSLDRARPQPPGSRTAAAGLKFLEAFGSDLACLVAQLWHFLTAARKQSA